MKATVGVGVLKEALKSVKGTLAKKDPDAVLVNFLLSMKGTSLTVASATKDLGSSYAIPAYETESGAILVPGVQFATMVEGLSEGGELTLTTDAHVLKASSGSFSATLVGMDTTKFPPTPEFPTKFKTVDAKGLLEAIQRVSFAICDRESMEHLLAVKITKESLVAANGHVLAVCEFHTGCDNVLIPADAVRRVTQVLRAAKKSTVDIGQSKTHLMFRVGEALYTAKLSAAKFPDHQRIVDTPPGAVYASLWRQELLDAIMRVGSTAPEKSRAITLRMNTGTCEVVSSNGRGSKSSEAVPCTYGQIEGEVFGEAKPADIILDFQELVDALTVLRDEQVSFKCDEHVRIPLRFEEPGILVFMTRLSSQVLVVVDGEPDV